jgi:hypothetical protein
MQAMRIIKARDHIAQAAYAAMLRVEAEAALCRLSPVPRDTVIRSSSGGRRHRRRSAASPDWRHGVQAGVTPRLWDDDLTARR